MAKLSDAPSPLVQIKALDGHLQIDEMIKTHAEVVCEVAEEIQDPPVQSESTPSVNPSTSFSPQANSHPLSPPATSMIWIQSRHSFPLPSLSFQVASHQHDAKKCPQPFCVSMRIKEREQKGEAVVISEDTVGMEMRRWPK